MRVLVSSKFMLVVVCGAVTLLQCGCDSATTPTADIRIQTDQETYALVLDDEINALVLSMRVSYTNPSSRTTYLPKCGKEKPVPVLQKLDSTGWINALSPVCPMILLPPIRVEPRQTYTQAVVLQSSLFPIYPRLSVNEISGTYRLLYKIYETGSRDGQLGDPNIMVPLAARVSNTFQITED